MLKGKSGQSLPGEGDLVFATPDFASHARHTGILTKQSLWL